MFTDYITLMLINMVAALVMAALFFLRGMAKPDRGGYVAGFAVTGLVALVCGFHMALTQPLPSLAKMNLSWANMAFGETTVLLGAILLAAALSLWRNWPLRLLGVLTVVGGLVSIVIGVGVWELGLSRLPVMTAAGFVLTGLAGLLAGPVLCREYRPLRHLTALLLILAALVWAATAYAAYWHHLKAYSTAPAATAKPAATAPATP